MGAEGFVRNMEKGLIEVAPLAYMRGRTLDNASFTVSGWSAFLIYNIKYFCHITSPSAPAGSSSLCKISSLKSTKTVHNMQKVTDKMVLLTPTSLKSPNL